MSAPSTRTRVALFSSLCALLLALLSVALLAPAVLALAFTSPANNTLYATGATSVNFTWDVPNVQFIVLSGAGVSVNTTVNATTYSAALGIGNYTATLLQTFEIVIPADNPGESDNATNTTTNSTTNSTMNSTDNASTNTTSSAPQNQTVIMTNATTIAFSIVSPPPPQTPQQVVITTDAGTYEVGTSARIRVVVATPEQLTMRIARVGGATDSYTINVQQQTDFLYPTTAIGNYVVTVFGSTVSNSTAFLVQNSTISATITPPTGATAGRVATFVSTVLGGLPPYTYQWFFSDNTTSTTANADHVFATNGTYNATLVVTDAAARVTSANTTVVVSMVTARLSVTTLGQNSRLLNNTLVVVTDSRGARAGRTDVFGSVSFPNLTLGNYTVNTTYNATEFSPVIVYNDSRVIEVLGSRSLTITFSVPDSRSTNTSSNSSSNATNTTPVTTPVPQTTTPVTTPSPASSPLPPITNGDLSPRIPSEVSAAAAAAESLERSRADALTELHAIRESISRSDTRSSVLMTLGLDDSFTNAEAAIGRGRSSDEIQTVLGSVPKDVMILGRDTVITHRAVAEAQGDIDAYIALVAPANKKEASRIRYSIEQALDNVTITSRRTVVHITNADGKTQSTYTIFSRESNSVGVRFIENIPKTVAHTVTAITVRGSHQVLAADPVIAFMQPSYSYFVADEVTGDPTVIPVPDTLQDPPSLLGLVAIKLNLHSFDHGPLYLAILGLVIAGILVGNFVLRSRTESNGGAFAELAELVLSLTEGGDYDAAEKQIPELETIFASLSSKEQDEAKDIFETLRDAVRQNAFKRSLAYCQSALALGDHIAIAAAYERVLIAHAALTQKARDAQQSAVDALHTDVEAHVAALERAAPASAPAAS